MLILLAGTWLAATAAAEAQIAVGDSKAFVIATLGRPDGQAQRGATELLFYEAGVIEITKGRVSAIDPDFEAKREQELAEEAFEDQQMAKGLVQWEDRWVTPAEKARLEAAKQKADAKAAARAGANAGRVKVLRQGGRAVNIQDLLVKGGVTIIDFYADWCGPCRAMAPRLERLVAENPDVYLRQIDIVNWQSDVASQYQLNSIPNVRVFDGQGRMVGDPTHSFEEVVRAVEQARGGS